MRGRMPQRGHKFVSDLCFNNVFNVWMFSIFRLILVWWEPGDASNYLNLEMLSNRNLGELCGWLLSRSLISPKQNVWPALLERLASSRSA